MEVWVEKYRPKKLDEIVGQDIVTQRLKSYVAARDTPHLLFSGPPGTAKTTAAYCMARELFGDMWHENFIELNASDERGIEIVRGKIKNFAMSAPIGDAEFKIIFLDESDALTNDAQSALRRTMEKHSNVCRFVLSCVSPDTKILLPEEIEITIDEFMREFEHKALYKVQTFDESIIKEKDSVTEDIVLTTIKLNPHKIDKNTYKITTMTGRTIKVTADHKLFTNKGWKNTNELTKKDCLYIYPNLEETYYEKNLKNIIDMEEFIAFLSHREETRGRVGINCKNKTRYSNLKTIDKHMIIKRIRELNSAVKLCANLTHKEEYNFKINNNIPLITKNIADIRNIVEKEFNIEISRDSIKNALKENIYHGNATITELSEKKLTDINYNSEKIGAIARLVGFAFGDGHLVPNDIRIYFTKDRKTLENVKKDIVKIGYNNFSETSSKKISNDIYGREVTGTTTFFYIDSRPLSLFLQYLGVPKGDKVVQSYDIPKFVSNGSRFVKREFLRGLFGADATTPKYIKFNFNAIRLTQNKIVKLRESMLKFCQGIKKLLSEFSVESYIDCYDLKEIRIKDSEPVLTFSIILNSSDDNNYKFFSKIGYAYEEDKQRLSRLSSEYLRHKKFVKDISKKISKYNFLPFPEWIEKYEEGIFVKNEVITIKEIECDDVRDITCQTNHNFLSNGILSHNCNYSSKIIEPIQSRCSIYKFKRIPDSAVIDRINYIINAEHLEVSSSAVHAIRYVAQGDMRRAINVLQAAAMINRKIDTDMIYKTSSVAKPEDITDLIMIALEGNFAKAHLKMDYLLNDEGLAGTDITGQIYREIFNINIPDKLKVELIDYLGDIDFRISEGSNERLQLGTLISKFILYGINKK